MQVRISGLAGPFTIKALTAAYDVLQRVAAADAHLNAAGVVVSGCCHPGSHGTG